MIEKQKRKIKKMIQRIHKMVPHVVYNNRITEKMFNNKRTKAPKSKNIVKNVWTHAAVYIL